MRRIALLAVLALAACGDVGTAERLSSKETLDGIDVPTIGTVGDFPDPAMPPFARRRGPAGIIY